MPDPSGYAMWQYGHRKPPAGVYPAALSPGGIGEIAESGASGSRMRCACVGKIDRVGKTGRARTEKPGAGLGTEARWWVRSGMEYYSIPIFHTEGIK